MLEGKLHPFSTFATLTYSDQNLPSTSAGLPTLDPIALRNFLKRLRKANPTLPIRYYATGEYGDVTQRPHYHLALFGHPNCRYGNTRLSKTGRSCCAACQSIQDAWSLQGEPLGVIFLGDLTDESAAYVAGYVTKKLTSKDDPRLLGRHPEFGRMSLKPGIGADFMHEVASAILTSRAATLEDAPTSLQHGSRKLPLGRYLRRKLRPLIGLEEATPETTIDALQETLRPMREAAFDNSRSFKKEVIAAGDQKVLNAETKAKIFKKGKIL